MIFIHKYHLEPEQSHSLKNYFRFDCNSVPLGGIEPPFFL